jgi:class 3 adenylate cyclase/predicted ATPase
VSGVRGWLNELGLERYAELFVREELTLEDLPDLTDTELKELGLPLGPRKTFLRAASGLRRGYEAVGAVEAPSAWGKGQPAGQPATAERRQLTVMFCDLVGSTELSRQLDPEELRRLIRQYQDACVGAISRFEGYVAQYLGDGVLAYFGYPVALEGGAERAIRAGLAVVERVRELSVQPLQVRVGIDTGLVVIGGEDSALDHTAVGDAPNLAAKLQGLAQPGSVVVSERTRQLAAGAFDYRDLGEQRLKGIAEAVRAWQVFGERDVETRFDAATWGTTAPMVGREMELDMALHAWQRTKSGKAQVLLLCGEPGIGKSRIVRALREALAAEGIQPWQYQCSPYFSNSTLYPVIAHLERALQFERDESSEARLDKLDAMLRGRFGRTELDLNLIGRLLGLATEQRYGALQMSPQKQKDETLRALIDLVQAASAREPVVLLYEDVHWADPTTLEAIDQLLKRSELPGLVVMTHRPEFKPPWIGQPHVTALTLGRLDPAQIEAVATRVAGGKALPTEIVSQIVVKTDGVPLFVEELTKAILESGLVQDAGGRYQLAGPLQVLAIPTSLRDSLMARLDRLAPVKEVAQIGACIGREFSDDLIAALSPLPRAELDVALGKLVDSELVFKRAVGKETIYVFKHALVQDAAYDSLLKSKRAEWHGKVAQAIAQHAPETVASEPELLARHYTAAGLAESAAPFWKRAGELALQRMALQEAVAHLSSGLELIPALAPTPARDLLEVELRTMLGTAWMALKGWAAPEVERAFTPALPLAKSHRLQRALVPILWGIWLNIMCQGRVADSKRWLEKSLTAADEGGDPDLHMLGLTMKMISMYFLGDLVEARELTGRILGLYEPEQHRYIADLINHDPASLAYFYRAFQDWIMGYPDEAERNVLRAFDQARRRGHIFDMGFTGLIGQIWLWRGQPEKLKPVVDHVLRLGLDNRVPLLSDIFAVILSGFVQFGEGLFGASAERLEQGASLWIQSGAWVWMPIIRAMLAEALAHCGKLDESMRIVNECVEQTTREGWKERFAVAEVLRVQGGVFERQGNATAAEQSYLTAIDWARKQRAKSWELRTATSLARLWRSQGKPREAHELLQPIYASFTEGFDTKDLKEASALLEALRA